MYVITGVGGGLFSPKSLEPLQPQPWGSARNFQRGGSHPGKVKLQSNAVPLSQNTDSSQYIFPKKGGVRTPWTPPPLRTALAPELTFWG